MKDLILHTQTRKALERIIVTKPHAILLTGNEGSGKRYISHVLAELLLDESLENHPYFIYVEPAGKSFSIDQIRELQKSMKLKTTGTKVVRRIAILQDVHSMTTEAQNALLKLLEEPPEDTVLILTAQGDKSLKPTVYSRVQRIHIKPLGLKDLPPKLSGVNEIQKLHSLSGGDMGLLSALLSNEEEHPLVQAIAEAKSIITAPVFKRLVRVDELSKDKERLNNIIMAIKRIATAALRSASLKNDRNNTDRWGRILEQAHVCESLLHTNANSKLLLTELFLTF